MDCPSCGAFNSMTAESCVCGFVFPRAGSGLDRRAIAMAMAIEGSDTYSAVKAPVSGGANEGADLGSFPLGFIAGMFGGILVLAGFLSGFIVGILGGVLVLGLVWRRGKPQTLRGLWMGFACQGLLLTAGRVFF
mgnify:CR=1 FL=1